MPIHVIVEAEVRPTEDLSKVKRAVRNVFVPIRYEVRDLGDRRLLIAEGFGSSSLVKLYKLLREERILDAARQYLLAGVRGRKIVFMLHKQAAFVGVVTFCDREIASPLGPIKFTVETDDPMKLIDWLAPRTVNGTPVEEPPPPD